MGQLVRWDWWSVRSRPVTWTPRSVTSHAWCIPAHLGHMVHRMFIWRLRLTYHRHYVIVIDLIFCQTFETLPHFCMREHFAGVYRKILRNGYREIDSMSPQKWTFFQVNEFTSALESRLCWVCLVGILHLSCVLHCAASRLAFLLRANTWQICNSWCISNRNTKWNESNWWLKYSYDILNMWFIYNLWLICSCYSSTNSIVLLKMIIRIIAEHCSCYPRNAKYIAASTKNTTASIRQ